MTERRQAPCPGKSAVTLLFLALIPLFFVVPLSISVDTQQALTVPFVLLSAAALFLGPYRRRDYTSPRRIGRRI